MCVCVCLREATHGRIVDLIKKALLFLGSSVGGSGGRRSGTFSGGSRSGTFSGSSGSGGGFGVLGHLVG